MHKELGIAIRGDNKLYTQVEPVQLTSWFRETMDKVYTKAIRINTEHARQALIVDNVLIELQQHAPVSFFMAVFVAPGADRDD